MTTNTVLAGFTVRTDLVAALAAVNQIDWTLFDGNQPTGETPKTYIIVGSNTDGEVITLGQTWHSLGLQAEREGDGTIYCTVASWSGDPAEASLCISRVRDAIADLDATARQLNSTDLIGALVTSAAVRQDQTSNGVQVRADVEITYTSVLTSWP